MNNRVNVLQPGKGWSAVLEHSEEHFNQTANATVPEHWVAELVTFPRKNEEAQRVLKSSQYSRVRIYGTSQESIYNALMDLLVELERMGFSGKLNITDSCSCALCGSQLLKGSEQTFGKVPYGE